MCFKLYTESVLCLPYTCVPSLSVFKCMGKMSIFPFRVFLRELHCFVCLSFNRGGAGIGGSGDHSHMFHVTLAHSPYFVLFQIFLLPSLRHLLTWRERTDKLVHLQIHGKQKFSCCILRAVTKNRLIPQHILYYSDLNSQCTVRCNAAFKVKPKDKQALVIGAP